MPAIYGGPRPNFEPNFDFGRREAEAWSDVPEATVVLRASIRRDIADINIVIDIWFGDVRVGNGNFKADARISVKLGKHLLEVRAREDANFLYMKPSFDSRTLMEVAFPRMDKTSPGLTFTVIVDDELKRLAASVRLSGKPFSITSGVLP